MALIARHKRLVLVLITAGILLYFLAENLGPKYCPAADCLDTAVYFKDRILQSLRIAYKDDELPAWNGTVGDKIIVMAHTSSEDVSWVEQYLPDWQRALYNVELDRPTQGCLAVPKNKGNEAMAYLTYIIDHYDALPSIMLFIHAHRDGLKGWHTDAPLHDHVYEIPALRLSHIEDQGYVNLRCKLNPGCIDGPLSGAKTVLTPTIWNEIFSNSSTPPRWMALQAQSYEPIPLDLSMFRDNDEGKIDSVPEIGVPCCAQFGVSRSAVLERGREDYIAFRQWILDTELPDATSGTAFEYLWHIIFGVPGISCPAENFCQCALYGRC